MILKNPFELAKDTFSKNLIISKVFLQKILEFSLRYSFFGLKVVFMLMPLLYHCFVEKQGGKKDSSKHISPNNFEIIFALLAKTIAI